MVARTRKGKSVGLSPGKVYQNTVKDVFSMGNKAMRIVTRPATGVAHTVLPRRLRKPVVSIIKMPRSLLANAGRGVAAVPNVIFGTGKRPAPRRAKRPKRPKSPTRRR